MKKNLVGCTPAPENDKEGSEHQEKSRNDFYRSLRISASADLTICGNELKLMIKLAKFNSSSNKGDIFETIRYDSERKKESEVAIRETTSLDDQKCWLKC